MTNHVHFKNSEDEGHSGEVVVSKISDKLYQVQLGILMAEHEYTVTFKVPFSSNFQFKKTGQPELTVKNVTIEKAGENESIFNATIITSDAHGQFEQNIELSNGKESVSLKAEFSLMNDHLGTPFLRDGLHCVRRVTTD